MGLDVRDVGHPDLIGSRCLEAPLQPVLGDYRSLAAISTGAALVAHLSCDPGDGCQPGNAVLRDSLTLVAQIVRQLAIAIDLGALGPGLPDQLGLARIFLRSVA